MSKNLINTIFKNYIRKGQITLYLKNGEQLVYGKKVEGMPGAELVVAHEQFFKEIVNRGNLGIGESYMNGYFTMAEGYHVFDLLDVLLVNELDKAIKSNSKLVLSIGIQRFKDSLKGKSHNIRRHYDIGFDIFDHMLDENLTYSCGYMKGQGDSLNDLQYQKFQRIIDKVQLNSGEHVLDIGCGYGSFLIYAAENYDISGVGITNSKQHADFGNDRIAKRGLADRLKIVCDDYKAIDGEYDKIVSIGMLEHVPRKEYKAYFKLIEQLLTPHGSALVHAVGCNTKKNDHDPFIQKYIFPNSNQPKLSEIAHQVEQNEMAIIDVENIIRHYRPTSNYWLDNFLENKEVIQRKGNYSEEFLKGWEYYLNCCVSAARYSDSAVYQVLINKSHQKHINYART